MYSRLLAFYRSQHNHDNCTTQPPLGTAELFSRTPGMHRNNNINNSSTHALRRILHTRECYQKRTEAILCQLRKLVISSDAINLPLRRVTAERLGLVDTAQPEASGSWISIVLLPPARRRAQHRRQQKTQKITSSPRTVR